MSRAEREALLAKLEKSQRDLEDSQRQLAEANQKLDDLINDEELFQRLASAKHGPANGPSGKGTRQETAHISADELEALQEQALRADDAEREMDQMRKKMMDMQEDAKNGKKVPALLKEVESLNEKLSRQKELAERHRQDQNRLNQDLKNQKAQVKALTAEVDMLQDSLSKVSAEREKLRAQLQERDDRIAELEDELRVMTNEEGAQRLRADSLSDEKDRLIAERTELTNLLASRDKALSELESASEQSQREMKRVHDMKAELEKQLRHARNRITEVEERERKHQMQSETTVRKLEGRLEELQDQLKNLGQVRLQFQELQKKYKDDTDELTAAIEALTTQNQEVSAELAETVRLAIAHQKIVGLYYNKINLKISVPPRQVLFKVWHLFTVASKYWNADERHKAMEAAVRKAKNESKSLRLRLGAAHRLVEEMQRRDKSISCASTLLAPAPSVDAVETAKPSEGLGASNGASVGEFPGAGGIGLTTFTSTARSASGGKQDASKEAAFKDAEVQDQVQRHEESNEAKYQGPTEPSESSPGLDKQCAQCLEIEGIQQRNTRLQAQVKKLEEQVKRLGESNEDLTAQLTDLKK